MHSEVELVRSLASNQYEPEELEEILKNFRIGWYTQGIQDYARREEEKRDRFRRARGKLFDIWFAELLSWFDDNVSARRDELAKEKYNYVNYRKPKRDKNKGEIRGPLQAEQD